MERKEEEETEQKRWAREVVGWGNQRGDRVTEEIPLPETCRLGNEVLGTELNHSGKVRNNFGMNKQGFWWGGQVCHTELAGHYHKIRFYGV